MKINLLTFHCALNFGAVLQAYALGRVLKNMGHEVSLLDLRPPVLAGAITLNPGALWHRWNFARFVHAFCPPRVATTSQPGQLRSLAPEADVCIVGSDQVWNPEITGAFAADYFLDFVAPGCRRISYGASFGRERLDWDEGLRSDVRRWLTAFDGVSMREASGLRLLAGLGVQNASHVLDPTLLLGDFKELLPSRPSPRADLLCMVFEPREAFVQATATMAAQLSLTPVALTRRAPDPRFRGAVLPSVPEWVRRFRDSAFVVTDSFHGLAMALIFNKPFVVVPANPDRFCRLQELLASLKLEDRIFHTYEELREDSRWKSPVSYPEVNQVLMRRREDSMAFLRTQLHAGRGEEFGRVQ